MNNKNNLEYFKSIKEEKYMNIDMNRLAVYGIWYLEENEIENTFENIVVCLFKLFPMKFNLKGYEIYPDSSKVIRTLLQLRPKYRNWAIKNKYDGYVLNKNGRLVLKQTIHMFESENSSKKAIEEPIRYEDLNEILDSVAYKKFVDGNIDEIQVFELYKLFHFASHTPQQDMEKKFKDLKRKSREVGNKDIEKFISYARKLII